MTGVAVGKDLMDSGSGAFRVKWPSRGFGKADLIDAGVGLWKGLKSYFGGPSGGSTSSGGSSGGGGATGSW